MSVSAETRKKLSDANKGKHHTPESRKKISEAGLGRIPSEETRRKMSLSRKGHIVTEETRKKISDAQKGKIIPLEQRIKSSISHKGQVSPNKGKKASPELKEKLRMAHLGKTPSLDTRIKQSLVHKGKNCGSKNGQWKGGISFEPYCPKFNEEFKERVRAFFGHCCVECGYVWKAGEKKLSVHHVTFNKKTCCDNSIPYFVPLCVSCHNKTHTNRIFWQYWFTEMINHLFNEKCYFSKDNVEAIIRKQEFEQVHGVKAGTNYGTREDDILPEYREPE